MVTPARKPTEINIKNSKISSKMITPKLEHPNDRRKQEWENEYDNGYTRCSRQYAAEREIQSLSVCSLSNSCKCDLLLQWKKNCNSMIDKQERHGSILILIIEWYPLLIPYHSCKMYCHAAKEMVTP